MHEPTLTVIGNLTADPALRTINGGTPVAHFTIAATPRTFDRNSNEWKDGETLFLRCSLWRQPAENLVTSLKKGDRVIVTGRLRQRTFDTTDGEQPGKIIELEVDEIGPSLRYATVTVTKTSNATHKDEHPQPFPQVKHFRE